MRRKNHVRFGGGPLEKYPYGQLAGGLPYHLKDLTEQLLLAVELGLRTLPGAFMADIEAYDGTTGETVTMYELFERRAIPAREPGSGRHSGRGVDLAAGDSRHFRSPSDAIELPPASAVD